MDKVVIIAEAGVNHNGDMDKAKLLIDAAVEAGVDYVKFQTFKADSIVSKQAEKADYQKLNRGGKEDSQYKMLKALELSEAQHQLLIAYCNAKGIKFFSTAFDTDGLDYLYTLGFDFFKIPSGEITNYPYLKKVATFNRPVILSTGMANTDEIKEALAVLTFYKLTTNNITVLHCNTEYPTPMQDVNIRAMNAIADEFNVNVGYSDHTLGIEVPIAAVALGAKVIEKHFTLDRNLPGPDHRASLLPEELKAMVNGIRNIELALAGSGKKEASASEIKNKGIARKSIHLKHSLEKGHILTENDLLPLRPGNGISPMQWEYIIGKKLSTNLPAHHLLNLADLE